MSMFEPDLFDFFGQAVLMQSIIKDFRNHLTIDLCQNNPRLVVMAMADIEMRATSIVQSMQAKMEEKWKKNNEPRPNEIE